MTYEDAVKSGMDGIDIFMGLCSGEIEEDKKVYEHPVPGRIVETRFDPYHDVIVYEDGHEERYYIGD